MKSIALYLLDDIRRDNKVTLQKFNPMGSPSWDKLVGNGVISACTVKDMILLLRRNSIEAIDSNTGSNLWTTEIKESA